MTTTEAFTLWKVYAKRRFTDKTYYGGNLWRMRLFVNRYPDLDIELIDEGHIHDWVNDVDREWSLRTRKTNKIVLGGFLQWCRDKGYIKNTRRPERLVVVDHRQLRPEQCIPKPGRCFSDAEVETLFNACRRNPKWKQKFLVPMMIATEFALRIGDILTMEWKQVGQRQLAVISEKTATWAMVPMSDEIIRAFAEMPRGDDGYIFGKKYENLVNQNQFRIAFSKMVRRCGIPSAGFHAFRHWCAARYRKSGVLPEHLSERMLHSNTTTTDKYGIAYELELEHPIFAAQNKAGGIQRTAAEDPGTTGAAPTTSAETQGDLFA